MAKLSDVYGITKPAVERKVPVERVRALEVGPLPLTKADARERNLRPFTFSLEPSMVYRLEERMRKERHRNRSETIRVLLAEALK